MSDLEKDFKETADKISNKLADAAKAIREATQIAKEAGVEGIVNSDYYDVSAEDRIRIRALSRQIVSYPLIRAMEEAGWQMSSIGC